MAQTGLQPQTTMQFLGVNLHQDPLTLADQEMIRAINADFHTMPGTCLLRRGRSVLFETPLILTPVSRLAKINAKRYQVAANRLFRDQQSIASDVNTTTLTTFAALKPLTDPTTWAFIANGAFMRKDNGTTLAKWGLDAPTSAPVIAALGGGALTGDYSIVYTYARKVGTALAHESNPSPASNTVTLSSQGITATALNTPTDSQITHIRVYRTLANADGLWLFETEVAASVTGGTLGIADSELGSAVEFDNDPPPTAPFIVEYQGSLFLLTQNNVYWSKRYRPESVPPENFVQISSPSDPLTCGVSVAGSLGVFTRATKYRVTGDTINGFIPIEALSKRGTTSPAALVASEQGAIFPALDGVFATNFISEDQRLSAQVDPLFFGETVQDYLPINLAAAHTFAAEVYKQRYYLAYAEQGFSLPNKVAVFSFETKHWYFYDHPVASLLGESDTGLLTAGSMDGLVYILEDGTTDHGADISFEAITKDYFGGSPFQKKLFFSIRLDLDTRGEDVTVAVYIDGILKRTAAFNSSRSRGRFRLPEGTIGYTWRVKITYTGHQRLAWYGALAQWVPLEVAA